MWWPGWLILFLSILSVKGTQQPPLATIPQGSLQGVHLTTRGGRQISGFLGIPYASAPVGPLRFQKPMPPGSWDGIRDASKPNNPCMQTNFTSRGEIFGDEDCLYLNIYMHKVTNEQKLPVLVFIHGGGFYEGYGYLYQPDYLMDKDIVLVTINYRLGALGFLSMEDKDLPGNNGLKDQVAALRWVKDNIGLFGGDSGAVTLCGESAGAASVHYHMLSKASKGLFHRAISQSGTALSPWAWRGPGEAQTMAERLAAHLGCNHFSTADILDCLRDMPAYVLVDVAQSLQEWHMDPAVLFPPTVEPANVEGAFLTSDPWKLTSHVLPWLTGLNSAEGAIKAKLFKKEHIIELNDDFEIIGPLTLLFRATAEDPLHTSLLIKRFYFFDSDITPNSFEELTKMYSDSWFLYPVKEALRRHRGTKYFYYFDYRGSNSLVPEYKGVSHFDDIPYFFPMNQMFYNVSSEDNEMSEKLIDLWTNFIIHGRPTLETSEFSWAESTNSSEYLHIKNSGFVMDKDLLEERDNFWSKLPYRQKYSVEEKTTNKKDEL